MFDAVASKVHIVICQSFVFNLSIDKCNPGVELVFRLNLPTLLHLLFEAVQGAACIHNNIMLDHAIFKDNSHGTIRVDLSVGHFTPSFCHTI